MPSPKERILSDEELIAEAREDHNGGDCDAPGCFICSLADRLEKRSKEVRALADERDALRIAYDLSRKQCDRLSGGKDE